MNLVVISNCHEGHARNVRIEMEAYVSSSAPPRETVRSREQNDVSSVQLDI
jgi:hypothetical protein